MVFVDRGSTSGVESGMAVVTPDGIVGKVVDAYPTASLVMLITDPTFAAGVVSQKNRVRGTLKGQGHASVWWTTSERRAGRRRANGSYTSGDDRIFPKAFPVGQVSAVRNGKTFKEIYVTPSGMQGGAEEVLIVLEGVHQEIPDGEWPRPAIRFFRRPPIPRLILQRHARIRHAGHGCRPSATTIYKQAGQAQKHVFGEGVPGSKPPDFTKIPGIRATAPDGALSTSPRPAATAATTPQNPPLQAPASPNASAANNTATKSVSPKSPPRPRTPPSRSPVSPLLSW